MAAPRKTLSELRTAVRDYIDEPTASFWSNAQLNRFINRAKDRVWTEVRKLKADYFNLSRTSLDGAAVTILGETYDTSGFRIVAGTLTYSLPPDHIEMKAIEVITSGLEYITFEHCDMADRAFRALRAETQQYLPETFLFDIVGERTLILAQRSDTTLNLRIHYTPIIGDLSADADTLEMPHALYAAVEEFATAAALKMDRDANSATWEQTGNASIARALGASSRQNQDPEFVQDYLDEWTGR